MFVHTFQNSRLEEILSVATQMKPCEGSWMGSDCLEVGGDRIFLNGIFGFATFRANEKWLSKGGRWIETGE